MGKSLIGIIFIVLIVFKLKGIVLKIKLKWYNIYGSMVFVCLGECWYFVDDFDDFCDCVFGVDRGIECYRSVWAL